MLTSTLNRSKWSTWNRCERFATLFLGFQSVVDTAVHFGSFDAELGWRPAELATLPAVPFVRSVAGMDHLLAVACRPDDLLLTTDDRSAAITDAMANAGLTHRLQVVSGPSDEPIEKRLAAARMDWLPDVQGWSASMFAVQDGTAQALTRLGLRSAVPSLESVIRVNSKVWSNAWVIDRGLPGAALVARSVEDLQSAVNDIGRGRVVIKDPYGVSGRGAIRVDSPRTFDTIVRHLVGQVERGGLIEFLVQPLFDCAIEFSSHLHITIRGDIEWLGLQTADNRRFAYVGSGPADIELIERLGDHHVELMTEVGSALYSAGYHGPAGVDGMLLANGDVVPVLEINARRSMGWLNLKLDERAARAGLRSWLRWYPVDFMVDDNLVGRVIDVLYRWDRLTDGERPGVLPLAMNPPCGRSRLFAAIFAATGDEQVELDSVVTEAVRRCDPRADAPSPIVAGRS